MNHFSYTILTNTIHLFLCYILTTWVIWWTLKFSSNDPHFILTFAQWLSFVLKICQTFVAILVKLEMWQIFHRFFQVLLHICQTWLWKNHQIFFGKNEEKWSHFWTKNVHSALIILKLFTLCSNFFWKVVVLFLLYLHAAWAIFSPNYRSFLCVKKFWTKMYRIGAENIQKSIWWARPGFEPGTSRTLS